MPAVPAAASGPWHAVHRFVGISSRHGALAVLALLAAGVPLLVWGSLGNQVVTPRLAGTALLTGVACIALATTRAPHLDVRRVRVALALLAALVAWSALATTLGVDRGGSLLGEFDRFQGLLPQLLYATLLVVAMFATVRAGTSRLLLIGIFTGAVLVGGYAVIQRLGLDWVQWTGIPGGRIGSAFGQPNVLGVELATALPASFGLWPGASPRQRPAIAVGCAVISAALLFTLSRGAWVGAGVGLAVFAVLVVADRLRADTTHTERAPTPDSCTRTSAVLSRASESLLVVTAIGAVVLGALMLVPASRSSLDNAAARARSSANLRDTSVSAHVGLWRTALEMVRDRPLVGAGPDAFSSLFAAYRTPDQPGIGTANVRPESAHNFFLDQAVSTGVPGLAIMLALIIATAVAALRKTRGDRQRRMFAIGMVSGALRLLCGRLLLLQRSDDRLAAVALDGHAPRDRSDGAPARRTGSQCFAGRGAQRGRGARIPHPCDQRRRGHSACSASLAGGAPLVGVTDARGRLYRGRLAHRLGLCAAVRGSRRRPRGSRGGRGAHRRGSR